MDCAACQKASNYVFCEECLAWLMESDTEAVSFDDAPEEGDGYPDA